MRDTFKKNYQIPTLGELIERRENQSSFFREDRGDRTRSSIRGLSESEFMSSCQLHYLAKSSYQFSILFYFLQQGVHIYNTMANFIV